VSDRPEGLEELVGKAHTTVREFVVEAGKIEEFARAIHDDNAVYYDRDVAANQGFDGVPAPLTFTRTATFPRYQTDESVDLGFRPEYVVHGGRVYEYERPVFVGDVLTGETTLVDISERKGQRGGVMTIAELETVYHDRSGERILAELATVIETNGAIDESANRPAIDDRTPDDGRNSNKSERPPRSLAEEAADDTDSGLTVPDPAQAGNLRTGDTASEVTIGPLERRDFVRYAGASGDFNPIHYDEPYARAAGNPRVFGQGMFTAGVAAHAVADWFGLYNVKTFGIRFQSRVWPEDVITASVEVTDIETTGTKERIESDVEVTRADSEIVLTGRATALLPTTR
jgi:peroxisomal enoyl-CoA hydratase 2